MTLIVHPSVAEDTSTIPELLTADVLSTKNFNPLTAKLPITKDYQVTITTATVRIQRLIAKYLIAKSLDYYGPASNYVGTTILHPNVLGLIITTLIKMASMKMANVTDTVDSEILIHLQRVNFVKMN
jgi:hypothetical protein